MNRFLLAGVVMVVVAGCLQFGTTPRALLPLENGPALSASEFEVLAAELDARLPRVKVPEAADEEEDDEEEEGISPAMRAEWWLGVRSVASPYPHVDYFRKAGIREYRGAETCLQCHREMVVASGGMDRVATLDDVAGSAHGRHQWAGLAVGSEGESDCLVCHSRTYDMGMRQVAERDGKKFMDQDRSLRAALGVGLPTAAGCLRCHGEVAGWDGEADVHARAGLVCTDCHVPVGHRLAGGELTRVTCQGCHVPVAHVSSEDKALFNGHGGVMWCEACHVRKLPAGAALLRGREGVAVAGHGIRGEGPACNKCHARQGGLVDFEGLGYAPERIKRLRDLPEL